MKVNSENIKFSSKNILFILSVVSIFFLTSCGSTRPATYFDDPAYSKYENNGEQFEPIIQPNDLLSIVVSSINPEAAQMFNASRNTSQQSSSTSGGNTTRASGYLVDLEGYINFPVLGKIKAANSSKKLLIDKITTMLVDKKLLLDPIVDIRYLNYKVSVLGEVKDPSVLHVPSEKISLLEALSRAGDITIFGRRDDITLIREKNGVKETIKIDLTTNDIFNSPFYYLQPNDIIYVKPNKAKVASSTGAKAWIPVILSSISLAVILAINL